MLEGGPSAGAAESSGERRVWIVDDSPLDAEKARQTLSRDYDVRLFSDGSAVLEAIDGQRPPDVVVLDWVMPGITGIEVCQFLRSHRDGHPAIAILLLTAHQQTDQIVAGLSAGANDYLSKPYAEPELAARVAALIRNRAMCERAEVAEASVHAFLASSPDPLIGVDRDGRITYVGGAATSAFGRAHDQLHGRRLSEILPELTIGRLVGAGAALAATTNVADVTIGGEIFAPTIRAIGDGDHRETIIAFRNVTERRRDEARRLDFYSTIAHDLRSPLNTVLLRTARIKAGKHGPLSAGLVTDIDKIEDSVRAQVALINDFLDFASVEGTSASGQDKGEVDLASIAEASLQDLQPLIEAGGLSARIDGPETPALVVGDARRLAQVVNNLVGNAIKYTAAGGDIQIRISIAPTYAEMSVADTGRGIAPAALPTLFDRFSRAGEPQQVAGTGLGLMIVREVVEAHGGTVGVESTLGRGSRFWFRLPRARLAPTVGRTPIPPTAPTASSLAD